MGRFNNNNSNGTPVDYSSSENDKTFDILQRVNEHLSDNDEEEKIKTKSVETDDADTQYKQEQENIDGTNDRSLREKGKNKNIGTSLLSPLNKHKIEEDNDNYISPFSDEYNNRKVIMQEEDEDYSQEEKLISGNRVQFYAIFIFILYILALALGYHFTSFSNGVPQITSMEQRAVVDYVGQVDIYIASLQDIHSESINYIENYTNGIVGATELETSVKHNNESIAKMQSELKDIVPPSQYENFQSQLTELYSLQATLNSATANYGKSKTVEYFNVVQNANEKYESTMDEFLLKYNELYTKNAK